MCQSNILIVLDCYFTHVLSMHLHEPVNSAYSQHSIFFLKRLCRHFSIDFAYIVPAVLGRSCWEGASSDPEGG